MSSPPTTLPSIQFLLKQQTSEDKKFTRGHRSTRSVSSLPSELQNLSLNGPTLYNPIPTTPSKDDSHLIKPQPSWMASPSATPMISSNTNTSYSMNHTPSQQRSTNAHHQRSISDLSMTTPSTNPIQTGFMPTINQLQPTQQYQPLHTPIPPPQQRLHHHPRQHHHQRLLSHRRAISATTVDHMMQPSSSSSTTTTSPVPPLPFYHRAHSNSPPENYLSLNTTKPQPLATFMDQPRIKQEPNASPSSSNTTTALPSTSSMTSNIPSTTTSASSTTPPPHESTAVVSGTQGSGIASYTTVNGMELPRDSATGRYLCPYCQKAFSRPSSLRIHTYSHTGEKPFVCSECPRRFSVQSNMRRHLRIHLVRPSNKIAF
ncbi:hypothetical protein BC941DRAFT_418909 [Chlamydoabsidia padenii]|nr:hypothetical protein BC941DRAFT_418909 [Chlamydoabsidia padenii]